jgi:hypothetical protein
MHSQGGQTEVTLGELQVGDTFKVAVKVSVSQTYGMIDNLTVAYTRISMRVRMLHVSCASVDTGSPQNALLTVN